jgi:RNA polymerase sigma factor (TIGR02999 family)
MNSEMQEPPSQEVTQLLAAWSDGDRSALDRLLPMVEDELHRLAHRYMSHERGNHTLQTTALVNEAYLKLIDQKVDWQSRAHFFGIAAQIMRRILIDHARKHLGPKHGGGKTISLEEVAVISDERASELVALDEALTTLAQVDERKSRLVELRYFGGLTIEETAAVLGVSDETIRREWIRAKAFLHRELSRD